MAKEHPVARVGDVLGKKYKLERILAAGGVGIIAVAVHIELGQRVAIKLLRSDVEPALKERFLREARAAVQLHSEHVARVTDVGRADDGTPYFVMELLSGEDLGALIARGPLPPDTAVELILQTCEGLAEAHALGIVHRDLKPRNLFLTRRVHRAGVVKILDFGIAKVHEPDGSAKEMTGTEMVFGSPQYMSPEQMRASRDVDARADIWSLGVCLYEMLAGTPPFDAATVPLLCVKVLTEPAPSLLDKRHDLPPGLVDVVMRCLAKDRAARFADVAELAAALEPFSQSHEAAARVYTVLHTPRPQSVPPPSLAHDPATDTRTAGSFDTRENGSNMRSTVVFTAAGVAAACAIAAMTLVLTRNHDAPPAASSTQQPVVSAPVETATSMTPPKAVAADPIIAIATTHAAVHAPAANTGHKIKKNDIDAGNAAPPPTSKDPSAKW